MLLVRIAEMDVAYMDSEWHQLWIIYMCQFWCSLLYYVQICQKTNEPVYYAIGTQDSVQYFNFSASGQSLKLTYYANVTEYVLN